MSAFRDGLKAMADEPPAFKIVPTKFGDIRVQAPLGSRVQEFVKALGDKAEEPLRTQGGVVALSCFDPETGKPSFGPGDIDWLNGLPAGVFASILRAGDEVAGMVSLDPTTPATPPG